MNTNKYREIRLGNPSLGCGLTFLIIALFVSAVGLKWIINGILILVLLLILTPILAWWGVNWWLKRSLLEADCPSCGVRFTGFRNQNCVCPNCGEELQGLGDHFERKTEPGTIDVEAIDVSVKQIGPMKRIDVIEDP
ncbi:MAG: hypothetical protein AAGG02_16765 [Cyanobacteria bacterium P01_H01_bin.15]